jgi:hypothetical protein
MCNILHQEGQQDIPESGVAYKLFAAWDDKPHPINWRKQHTSYIQRSNGWIHWKVIKDITSRYITRREGDGFCVFLNKTEALRCLETWNDACDLDEHVVLREVDYRGGIGACKENNITADGEIYIIGIVKEWRLRSETATT